MPIPHYGVWVGQPTRYTAQRAREDPKSPHIHLKFTDGSSREFEAAINVKSIDKDSRLVFWLPDNLSHSITEQLSKLDEGFHLAQSSSPNDVSKSKSQGHHRNRHHQVRRQESDLRGLDFIRTDGLINIKSGLVLQHDIPGENNDILDKMEPILQKAIDNSATSYIFGSSFGSGIHDVHMNQGSLPRFDNGIYEDGALLFQYGDGHWEAVFLAFASQRIPTNSSGEPERDSETLADILGQ
ncbi:hypothetical protein N7481_011373 [Penicillium waksmanii]|uniref:uncharacterized protein n=1 Tax=Penicillium waksmanii TaxID=69791 RepID=UPI002549BDFB|nr:uncharacterized protein N7481_011373 [Penicillium waksmanii]KAJ5974163.1 hypothetical protein N7481_011373 [Penicillium waksmanii]